MDSPRLQILHTPATLASDHEAGTERERFVMASAGGKKFGPELRTELLARANGLLPSFAALRRGERGLGRDGRCWRFGRPRRLAAAVLR